MKSKPAQQSVFELNSLGIFPDFVICRAERALDERRREKIALSAALDKERIFSAPDLETIYQTPLVLQKQKVLETLLKVAGLRQKRSDLIEWKKRLKMVENSKKPIRVGIVGKYYQSGSFSLADAYVCVVEAIKHAAWYYQRKPEIVWINSEELEQAKNLKPFFKDLDAVVVPGGFGLRGIEGKVKAVEYVHQNKIPYLGLCYGMQMATIEFARDILGWQGANTTEIDAETKYPVIHLMSEQEKKMLAKDYGGTMRLGAWPCLLKKETNSYECYRKFGWFKKGKPIVEERHRHRFEFNNKYREEFEKAGLVIAGTTPDGKLVEIIELPKKEHPFFVGVQFHPEFQSRFLRPHPLFLGLIKSAVQNKNSP